MLEFTLGIMILLVVILATSRATIRKLEREIFELTHEQTDEGLWRGE